MNISLNFEIDVCCSASDNDALRENYCIYMKQLAMYTDRNLKAKLLQATNSLKLLEGSPY